MLKVFLSSPGIGGACARSVAMLAMWSAASAAEPGADDPHLWLEDIDSAQALAWVNDRNEATAQRLTARPGYDVLYRDALTALNSQSRIPLVEAHGEHLYNFWQDAAHPRGLYRRTTLAGLKQDEPQWETVLDVDALARDEGKPWALGERFWRRPDETRVLLQLSPGGGDAVEVREFDVEKLQFVPGGFVVPTAKSRVGWAGDDALYVATDFGPGTLTTSGYPRIVKRWTRGTPLSEARTLHEAPPESVWALARRLGSGRDAVHVLVEGTTFWTSRFFLIEGDVLTPLTIPATANVVDALNGRLVIWLKEDWARGSAEPFKAGAVVIADPRALVEEAGAVELLAPADERTVVQAVEVGTDDVLVTYLDNVRGRLMRLVPEGKQWRREVVAFPDHGTVEVVSVAADTGDAWVKFESFTTPPTLFRVAAGGKVPEQIKAQAPTFDGGRFAVEQLWCTSADGTRVPYFVVGAKGMKRDGSNPVWMFSYGGFENSLTPSYSGSYEDLKGVYGKLWLERGGVFVLANIRGGGEFGPAWHTSVLKENHFKCFEDFEAVARDLVTRKITTPERIGIEGRSNGGLLVTATMLRHPELYGAVVCGNPLIDMQRYHRLLAGASWMAEYGNPDVPAEWAYIREYSPYQNVRPGMKLPPILFYTTTRDDRVHPGHARKMAAKMAAMGYAVDYYENTEGGHHGSVTNEQLATRVARTFAFLWEKLGGS
jgi:prolyl oligopeptidase